MLKRRSARPAAGRGGTASGAVGRAAVDCVIFDLDGVLADSEAISCAVLREELASVGLEVSAEEFRRDFLGKSFPAVAAHLRRRGALLPEDFEARYQARLFASFQRDLRPTPGLVETLAGLKVAARIATSSAPVRARRTLETIGLWDRFGARLDTASEVANGKPAPDLFLLSAERAGVPPGRCLVIEDSAPGIAAAAAAGMRSILYRGGAHHRGWTWEGPLPSVGAMTDWAQLGGLVPGILED